MGLDKDLSAEPRPDGPPGSILSLDKTDYCPNVRGPSSLGRAPRASTTFIQLDGEGRRCVPLLVLPRRPAEESSQPPAQISFGL